MPLIIRLIIQTILLYPSGAVQIDAEHPSRNRKAKYVSASLRLVAAIE